VAGDELTMWVVYQPATVPGGHQAREWVVTGHGSRLTGHYMVGPLDLVQGYLADRLGLTRLDRHPDDDSTIVETWL
jgi:hypothetical protein